VTFTKVEIASVFLATAATISAPLSGEIAGEFVAADVFTAS
jgi:hypothetical protein